LSLSLSLLLMNGNLIWVLSLNTVSTRLITKLKKIRLLSDSQFSSAYLILTSSTRAERILLKLVLEKSKIKWQQLCYIRKPEKEFLIAMKDGQETLYWRSSLTRIDILSPSQTRQKNLNVPSVSM
jgi:hypothetical protein